MSIESHYKWKLNSKNIEENWMWMETHSGNSRFDRIYGKYDYWSLKQRTVPLFPSNDKKMIEWSVGFIRPFLSSIVLVYQGKIILKNAIFKKEH